MFIKNFSSINKDNIVLVDDKTREYLLSQGFCELSKSNDKWAFAKTDDLLNIIDNYARHGGDSGNE